MILEFKLKQEFIVNGKEYNSIEEMPSDLREAYAKAVAKGTGAPGQGGSGIAAGKIVFNGREYAAENEMDEDERQVYRQIMKSVQGNTGLVAGGMASAAPAEGRTGKSRKPVTGRAGGEKSFSAEKVFTAAAVLLALIAALLYLVKYIGNN